MTACSTACAASCPGSGDLQRALFLCAVIEPSCQAGLAWRPCSTARSKALVVLPSGLACLGHVHLSLTGDYPLVLCSS